jgi:NADH:ubiquinone oxidoreductase subunit 5 (subunit L)/multisubunit Na+/H+ antiporter MnhA subunit
MVVNKIGDCFFLVGTALFLQLVGHTNFFSMQSIKDPLSFYSVFFSETLFFGFSVNSIFPVLLFFFFGIMAKSAQFGFHT